MKLVNIEQELLDELSLMIEKGRHAITVHANNTAILTFWHIGKRINEAVLQNKRAEYGKQIVSTVSTQLKARYGNSYELRNLRRMMQFANHFEDIEIVSMLSTQLSWSHFIELLPLKTYEAQLYYAKDAKERLLTVLQLRKNIQRKAFERKEIANTQISSTDIIPLNTFRDPYLFDYMGLSNDYAEEDLEMAVMREIEKFILEVGKGFTFVARQKRMIIDGHDFHLDLLLFNRYLKRLVAVELKQGEFEAEFKGKMELYLKWLNRYERIEDENEPIGLILCAEGNREQIELLEMDKSGIMVAQYWTALPPKAEFSQKIQAILAETRERMKQRKLMLGGEVVEENDTSKNEET
jgi:predicted nuclease of restriction endonuclease-like (RecB) superfamily